MRCLCGELLTGRSDKKWCTMLCRSRYTAPEYVRRDDARPYHKWSTDQLRFVQSNLHLSNREVADRLGLNREQVESFRKRNELRRVVMVGASEDNP